jgi:flagellar biosynthesis chaperone FliJ
MNLTGKILLILIWVSSLAFSALACLTYTTHQNWYKSVNDPQKGLRKQLADARTEGNNLKAELQKLAQTHAAEKQQLVSDLSKAQQEARDKGDQLVRIETEYDNVQKQKEDAVAAKVVAENNLAAARTEVVGLRDDIRKSKKERDDMAVQVAKVADENFSLNREVDKLGGSNVTLLAEVSKLRAVIEENVLNPYIGDKPPSTLRGFVTAAGDEGEVVMNLGSDDGLRIGHTMEVVRANKYLGRLEIVRVEPELAVGRVLPDYRQGPIQKGDSVKSSLK